MIEITNRVQYDPRLSGALCATHPEPDLWFSPDEDDQAAARAICGRCPAQTPCLSKGLAETPARRVDRQTGIWGGADANQLRGMRDREQRDGEGERVA